MTTDRDDALGWLRYAAEDLAAARAMLDVSSVVARHPAWLAQQAAEKAIKALLVAAGRPFPKTHDLDRLARLLPDPSAVLTLDADLSALTEYAVGSRYPGDLPDSVAPEEARHAVEDAARVLSAAQRSLDADA
ncbi:MAG: HEPN domain-containing protein [Bacteroidota bacterium]